MTSFTLNTTTITPQVLNANESGYVGRDGVIQVLNGPAVTMSGAVLTVQGDVFSSQGDAVKGDTVGNSVSVGSDGSITCSQSDAIDFAFGNQFVSNSGYIGAGSGFEGIEVGDGGNVIHNFGTVEATGFGILFTTGVGATGQTNVVLNTGALSGLEGGLSAGDTNDEVRNSGLIISGAGNAAVTLGAGTDSLNNSGRIEGEVRLGAGNDLYAGTGGTVLGAVLGEAGQDFLLGGRGADTLSGGADEDAVAGAEGDDLLTGGLANDQLYGGAGNDFLFGEDGNDYIEGNEGRDYITGEVGNDTLNGGTGDDTITAGEGSDAVYGAEGNDTIYLGQGNDIVYGGDGNDLIYDEGGAYNIIIADGGVGQDGNDTFISLGTGESDVYMGGGDDTAYGGSTGDILRGQDGNDYLNGGGGDDYIVGGNGSDVLTGGTGADKFILNSLAESGESISDFNRAEGDQIWLSSGAFGIPYAGSAFSTSSFAASGPSFLFVDGSGQLYYDPDGSSGVGAATLVVSVSPSLHLTAADLFMF